MIPFLITAPVVEPLSLAEAKSWLRVDGADEDAAIQSLITSARLAVEAATNRLLITQQWRVLLDAWPSDLLLPLPLAPVRQVVRVRIADAAGLSVDLPANQYRLDGNLDRARLVLSAPLPNLGQKLSGICIDLVVGYGDASAAPEAFRLAMRQLVALWFAERGDGAAQSGRMPASVVALLAPYRIRRLA